MPVQQRRALSYDELTSFLLSKDNVALIDDFALLRTPWYISNVKFEICSLNNIEPKFVRSELHSLTSLDDIAKVLIL